MHQWQALIVEAEAGVALVRLNRPKSRNAMSYAMVTGNEKIVAVLKKFGADINAHFGSFGGRALPLTSTERPVLNGGTTPLIDAAWPGH